ncbi:MAG TPA: hypothetical protein VKY19_24930 [Ktedonosporobacter sp.]|jgi:hypothetical protein|nr:hypothetical protein [Ktedonosporobacter sp.]
MITGGNIDRLVRLFATRDVKLFHACQFLDFLSYLKLGGIPSHDCLEKANLPFTPLETDENDKANGVWDKVFVNLSDFGTTFANGGNGVPNPYGPILIQVRPAVLLEATDIAISLRSAGAQNFDREKEALKTLEDVNKLFTHPANIGSPESQYVKYRKALREDFQYADAADPEISCSVSKDFLPFHHGTVVIVDPYIIQGRPLYDWVRQKIQDYKWKIFVRERTGRQPKWHSRKRLYNELSEVISAGTLLLQDLLQKEISTDMGEWAQTIRAANLDLQFRRFARYLHYGTLEYSYSLDR